MKIAKYLGAVLLVLGILFLSLGLAVPTFDYSSSVTINAPIEKCWTVLQDTSRMKRWVEGFERMTLREGEAGKSGAVYELVIQQDKLYVMQETVKELRAPELASFELANDVMRSKYEFKLSGEGSRTRITSVYHIEGNNMIWKSILFVSKSYLQTGSQNQLDLLKIEIESGDLQFE